MKILISADLEGVTGVIHPEQIYPEGKFYKETLLTAAKELNAIVAGLNEAGVSSEDIIINDSHNHMRNLDTLLLPKACLLGGWQKPFSMVSGVDSGIDACFFTGYHCMAGVDATLSHTYRPRIMRGVWINGIEVGETGLNAALAGHFGVPVTLLAGDDKVCEEAKKLLGSQLITVETKKSVSRYSAISHPLDKVLADLRAGAKKAVEGIEESLVYKVKSPTTLTLRFMEPNHADAAELIPGVKKISDNTVEYTNEDYSEVFKCFLAMGALAASRDDLVT